MGILEQVFGNDSCVNSDSDIKRRDISGASFSGNEIEDKVYKQSRVLAIEDKPQTEKVIEQDSQTCNQFPIEVCFCQMFQVQFRNFRKWKTVFFF